MIRFECDKCGQAIERRDLRQGEIDSLSDSVFKFELCFGCYLALRRFLRPEGLGVDDKTACAALCAGGQKPGLLGDTSA